VLKLTPALQQSKGRSKPWAGSRLVNAFAELSEGDKADTFAVMAIPGLNAFSDIGTQPVRGMWRMAGVLYVVAGSTLYSVASDGTETALGTITGTLPCRMADNGSELAIHGGVNGDTGYVYSGGVLYSSVPNLPQVTDVCFIDGYFVWPIFNSDQFIISGLNDGLSYDPLDVGSVEGSPDAIVGVVNDHRELHFYSTDTVEIYYNSGAADFPFERQGNAFIERGCADKNSIVKIDNSTHFVGDDLMVYRLNGYTPERISTHAIEWRLAQATYFWGLTYTQEGHEFYVLNTDAGTFAFDMATRAWAERLSYGRDNYRISCAVSAYGRTILGDAYTGKLYTPSLDTYDEDGDPILVTIEPPAIEAERERATLYALELYCETGVGNTDDPDPQVIMRYSRNGGRSWSNELWRGLGAIGEYETRAVWRPNVQFRQLQLQFQMPSRTRRFVIGYYADWR
jgi:hypothetical protein